MPRDHLPGAGWLLRDVGCAVNGLCAISDERYASAADNVKIWSIESEE